MPIVSIATLKAYFGNSKVPAGPQYEDLVDTLADLGGVPSTHDHTGGEGNPIPLAGMANLYQGTLIGRQTAAGTGIPMSLDQGSGGGIDVDYLDGYEASDFLLCKAGTSFPGSPVTGDLFYRTDLRWMFQYTSGIGWLSTTEFVAHFYPYAFSSTSGCFDPAVLRTDATFFATRWAFQIICNTAQDASNYWRIVARSINAAFSSATNLGYIDCIGDSASVNTHHEADLNYTNSSNKYWLDYTVNKNGSPGNITITVSVYYRMFFAS